MKLERRPLKRRVKPKTLWVGSMAELAAGFDRVRQVFTIMLSGGDGYSFHIQGTGTELQQLSIKLDNLHKGITTPNHPGAPAEPMAPVILHALRIRGQDHSTGKPYWIISDGPRQWKGAPGLSRDQVIERWKRNFLRVDETVVKLIKYEGGPMRLAEAALTLAELQRNEPKKAPVAAITLQCFFITDQGPFWWVTDGQNEMTGRAGELCFVVVQAWNKKFNLDGRETFIQKHREGVSLSQAKELAVGGGLQHWKNHPPAHDREKATV